jgi:hypothetical protein
MQTAWFGPVFGYPGTVHFQKLLEVMPVKEVKKLDYE